MTLELILLTLIAIISIIVMLLLIAQTRKQDVMSGRADEQTRQFDLLRNLVDQKVSQMQVSMNDFQNQLKTSEFEMTRKMLLLR